MSGILEKKYAAVIDTLLAAETAAAAREAIAAGPEAVVRSAAQGPPDTEVAESILSGNTLTESGASGTCPALVRGDGASGRTATVNGKNAYYNAGSDWSGISPTGWRCKWTGTQWLTEFHSATFTWFTATSDDDVATPDLAVFEAPTDGTGTPDFTLTEGIAPSVPDAIGQKCIVGDDDEEKIIYIATQLNEWTLVGPAGALGLSDVENVMFYGATGDGVTDDSAAVQLAMDAAEISGHPVFFPPGIYLMASTIYFPDGVTVYGVAGKSIIRLNGNGSLDAVASIPRSGVTATQYSLFAPKWIDDETTDPFYRVTFRDLRIVGVGSWTTARDTNAILLWKCHEARIDNVFIEDINAGGYAASASVSCGVYFVESNDGTVSGGKFSRTGYRGLGSEKCTRLTWTGCLAEDNAVHDYQFSRSDYSTMSGVSAKNTTTTVQGSICLHGASDCSVMGAVIEVTATVWNYRHAITNLNDPANAWPTDRNTLSGCVVNSNEGGIGWMGGRGNVVSGNTVTVAGGGGIFMGDRYNDSTTNGYLPTDAMIIGNVVVHTGTNSDDIGIELLDFGSGQISNNRVIAKNALKVTNADASAGPPILTNNILRGSVAGMISPPRKSVRFFDGTDDKMEWASPSDLADAAFTVAGWIYADALPASNPAYVFATHNADGSSHSHVLNITSTGALNFTRVFAASAHAIATSAVIAAGRWYYVEVTFSGTWGANACKIYLDGALLTPASEALNGSGGALDASGVWILGGRKADNARQFHGRLFGFGAWNAVLSTLKRGLAWDSGPRAAPTSLVFAPSLTSAAGSDPVSATAPTITGTRIDEQ